MAFGTAFAVAGGSLSGHNVEDHGTSGLPVDLAERYRVTTNP
jgi:hypothetical protein